MLKNKEESYREILVQEVKAISRDLDRIAADLVGGTNGMCNFEIHLKFPPDALPTIELVREHIGEEAMKTKKFRWGDQYD